MCPFETTVSVFEEELQTSFDELDEIEYLVDATSLIQCPLENNVEIYTHLGSTVTSLTVSSISETEVESVFPYFKCVRHLTLQSLNLLNENATDYPDNLKSLTITDCKVSRVLVDQWFRVIGHSLTSIQVSRSHYKLSLDHEGSLAEAEFLALLPNVRHLRLKESGVLKFSCPSSTDELSRLELVAKKCVFTGQLLFLKYLSFDVHNKVDAMLGQLDCKETLTTLILRNCPRDIKVLWQLKKLRHLRIMNGVDATVKMELEMLPELQTLEVHCAHPLIDNQLLMLDDDSLIQILSYLTLDDWLSLMQTHPRLEELVCSYMLLSAQVKVNDKFLQKYPLEERKEIYTALGQNTRSLIISCDYIEEVLPHFVCLQKLYMPHRDTNPDSLNIIPDGLTKLDLFIHHENQSLVQLFRRLNSTLRSLEVCGPFNGNDLIELHNIRELKLGGFTPSSINITEFLQQNHHHLERLEIKFYDSDMDDDEYYNFRANDVPSIPFSLCPMKKLKVLRLDSLNKSLSLLPSIFPALEEIRISFDNYANPMVMRSLIDSVMGFTQLKALHINGLHDYRHLYRLKNLQCLEIYEEFLPESVVLDLIKNLPKLDKIGTENESFSLEFELSLQKMMFEQKRRITLYHCVWPATRIRFGVFDVTKVPIRRGY